MKVFIDRYKNILFLLTAVLIAPLVWGVLTFGLTLLGWQFNFLFEPVILLFFRFLDAGRIAFATYIVLVPLLLLLVFSLLISLKKLKVFFYLPFYFFLIGSLVFIYLFTQIPFKKSYFPAFTPELGINYQIVDYPRGINNIYKTICIYAECKGEGYEIQGWLTNDILVYKKWDPWVGVFQYSTLDKKSSVFRGSLKHLDRKMCDCILKFFQLSSRPLGCLKTYVSPDGNKFACVATHVYGPQDILIFQK